MAYETALRTLDRQDHLVQELRARTGVLLAASSLAISVMGHTSFDQAHSTVLAAIAVAIFFVALIASIYVLVPRRALSFSPSARVVYETLYELRNDMAEAHRHLVYELDACRVRNDRTLERLTRSCQLAGTALAIEIALLAILTTDRII